MTPFALVTGDFVRTGGMDRANFALASYLLRRGHPVHLVGFRADPALTAHPGATWHPVPKPLGSYALALPLLRRRGAALAARVAGQGGRVLVNGGSAPVGDINWVHYLHAGWDPPPARHPARRWKDAAFRALEAGAEADALRRARVVIANSEGTRAALLGRFGLPPERVHTVYYGTDPDLFRPATPREKADARARLGWPEGVPVLAFVGALGDARKGFDTLLEAWARLARDPPWGAKLAVVGAGATLPHWRAEAARRGIAGSVEFLGFRRDVPAVLRACDGLASPARYEAYGLNAHEALACGLPALVSRSSGVAERYPAALRDWLLPDPDDPADLAARLARWRLGVSGGATRAPWLALSERLRAETWDRMAARLLEAAGIAL